MKIILVTYGAYDETGQTATKIPVANCCNVSHVAFLFFAGAFVLFHLLIMKSDDPGKPQSNSHLFFL